MNKPQDPEAAEAAQTTNAPAVDLPLPDTDGLWWQWYQSEWRLCEAAYSRIMGRWEYRWNNGAHWFRCYAGFFVRCEPPKILPLGAERMSEAQCSSPSAPGGNPLPNAKSAGTDASEKTP